MWKTGDCVVLPNASNNESHVFTSQGLDATKEINHLLQLACHLLSYFILARICINIDFLLLGLPQIFKSAVARNLSSQLIIHLLMTLTLS